MHISEYLSELYSILIIFADDTMLVQTLPQHSVDLVHFAEI